jgi:hypothetical protein
MAQTGYTPILIYASGTATNVPLAANLTSSASGAELALNYADGRLFYKNGAGVVTLLASAAGALGDVVGPASATDNALARFDTTTGKLIQNSVGILSDAGVLTGLTGLTSSGTITLSSLTSGRVVYTTTGGALTDSANLLYSGTDLTVYGLTVGRGAGAVATNTAVGASALAANTTGSNNVALGFESGSAITTGANNTFLGFRAGKAVTTASGNAVLGDNALLVSTTGGFNVAIGNSALQNNTASENVALGSGAATANTSGTYNVAVGRQALTANTTASNNTAVGYQALVSSTTGTALVAVGAQAGYSNTTGVRNTSIGQAAGYSTSTGNYNTFVGYTAGYFNTTGNFNIGIGDVAMNGAAGGITGQQNIATGHASMYSLSSGSQNVAYGTTSLYANTTGNNNTAIGWNSLNGNTTASNNTAVGYQAGFSNTTGESVDAFGLDALYSNTTGTNNAAFGFYALRANTTGTRNAAFARGALAANTTGGQNVSVGVSSMNNNTTGSNNVAIGDSALLSNTTSNNNTAVGYQALYANTTGTLNVSVGTSAGTGTTTGSFNTFVGRMAGRDNVTGESNAYMGLNAGLQATGSFNTFVGSNAGDSITTGAKNSILGRYNGNQGGIDIRTSNNNIVLSDGDGNPRQVYNNTGGTGLGAVPLNAASIRGYELGTGGAAYHGNGSRSYLTSNAFWNDAQWTRVGTAPACQIVLDHTSGSLVMSSSATGSAGTAVAWVNVLEVNRNFTLALQGASQQSGTGITFPATQNASSDANTLDDYEEGAWTPSLAFGGGTTGITYNDRYGFYVKIGKLVQVSLRIVLSNKGSSTGTAKIQGLPFAAGGTKSSGSVFYVDALSSLGGGIALGNTGGLSDIELFTFSATSTVSLTNANFGNNTVLELSMVYTV